MITTFKRLSKSRPYIYMIWTALFLFYFAVGAQESFRRGIYLSVLFTSMQFLAYSVNNYFLVPSFFDKEKPKFYVLNLIFLLIIVSFFTALDYYYLSVFFFHDWEKPSFFFPFFLHWVMCFIALWVSIAQHLMNKEKITKIEIEQLKREKAETELKFLKMQINPHFLFNALNNIYTMAYIGDKSAPEKIATLSNMLRYVLYDCESDYIPINKEIEYIEDYIEFQQLKTENEQNITFHYNKEHENYMIAPMLLIPFIENAFKYSKVEKDPSGYVSIFLSMSDEGLSFIVKNSSTELSLQGKSSKGIGIENVKNRLELLYPGKFKLYVRAEEREFSTYLHLRNNESRRKI